MYKFEYSNTILIDDKLSTEEIQNLIDAKIKERHDYFSELIEQNEKICAFFKINSENYSRFGHYEREIFDYLVALKEEYSKEVSIKLIFDLTEIGNKKEAFEYIPTALKNIKQDNFKIDVCLQFLNEKIDLDEKMPTILTAEEFEYAKICESKLQAQGTVKELHLQEGKEGTALTIKQVETANNLVSKIAKKIKDMNLSPFEAAVYIHDFCSQFYYNKFDKSYNANALADVVSSGNITCVGYASMFKAIVDELEMTGLKANLAACFAPSKFGHATNIVNIEDEKYSISGTYMHDSCNSAIFEGKPKSDFLSCLYPVDDIPKMYTGYRFVPSINMQSYYGIGHAHDLGIYKMNDAEYDKFMTESHEEFLKGIKNKGTPIDIEKYAEAYCESLVKSGYSNEDAEKIVSEKINYTIARAALILDENTTTKFYQPNTPETFMKKHLSEFEYIDFQIKQLAKKSENASQEKKMDFIEKRLRLKERQSKIIAQESVGNAQNKKILNSELEK